MKQWLAPVLGAGLLMAGPALAGDPRGGHGGQGGGHHPPAPPPPACCHGGGNVNINVNAHVSATAYAGAGGYINAHGYDLGGGGYRGGGGVVYVGGGYGGDAGVGYYGGGAVYAEAPAGCGAPPSAPFGYAVQGMGRDYRNAPVVRPEAGCPGGGGSSSCESRCDSHGDSGDSRRYEIYYEERSESGSTWTREDRGGRYGDSRSHEQQDRSGGGHPPAPTDGWVSYGCGCGSSDGGARPYGYDHDGDAGSRGDSDHRPPPPRYEPPAPPPAQPPHRPRQEYRQEPGERG